VVTDRPFDDDELRTLRAKQRELLASIPLDDVARTPPLRTEVGVRPSAERAIRDRIEELMMLPHGHLLESECRNDGLRSAIAALGEQTSVFAELTLGAWKERKRLLMETAGFDDWLAHLVQLLWLADLAAAAGGNPTTVFG
jgi:hypothetical protein